MIRFDAALWLFETETLSAMAYKCASFLRDEEHPDVRAMLTDIIAQLDTRGVAFPIDGAGFPEPPAARLWSVSAEAGSSRLEALDITADDAMGRFKHGARRYVERYHRSKPKAERDQVYDEIVAEAERLGAEPLMPRFHRDFEVF